MEELPKYKIITLGDTSVGKSSLLQRFTSNRFSSHHLSTIGLDQKVKKIKMSSGEEISLQIWDTAGQERF